MLKEGNLHAPRNIQGTLACDSALPWTAGECFAVIFATRGPSSMPSFFFSQCSGLDLNHTCALI
jgi:hypothetical protein